MKQQNLSRLAEASTKFSLNPVNFQFDLPMLTRLALNVFWLPADREEGVRCARTKVKRKRKRVRKRVGKRVGS